MYAGRLCGRCRKGCNSEKPINGFEEEKKKQKKRYGAIPCNNCLTELLGGDEKVKKLTQQRILKEMGKDKRTDYEKALHIASVSKNKPLPPPPPKDREIHISGKSRHKR